jgi:hypothetical protein
MSQYPNVIQSLIDDYNIGPVAFWKHRFLACLLEINDIIRRDDTYESYFHRTNWRHANLLTRCANNNEVTNQINSIRGQFFGRENPKFLEKDWKLDSVIHRELEPYFSEYDYSYRTGTVVTRMISDYVGLLYEFESISY